MTLNLAGVGALGYMASADGAALKPLLAWACVALVLTCIVWGASNRYYTSMLGAK